MLNATAAILHLGCIYLGTPWYRFFGAGEHMVQMSAQGQLEPTLITLFIFFVLAIWSLYAFVGAGVKFKYLPKLPFVSAIIWCICIVLFLRGIVGFIPVIWEVTALSDRTANFWIFSSFICLLMAAFHYIGLKQMRSS